VRLLWNIRVLLLCSYFKLGQNPVLKFVSYGSALYFDLLENRVHILLGHSRYVVSQYLDCRLMVRKEAASAKANLGFGMRIRMKSPILFSPFVTEVKQRQTE
jgi:hypothetical protein